MGIQMNRPVDITTRPQVALQSYLDALLQEATEELPVALAAEPEITVPVAVEPEPVSELDEFQAAVLEEQARDALAAQALVAPVAPAPVPAPVEVAVELPVARPV